MVRLFMGKRTALTLCLTFLFSTVVGTVHAADGSAAEQFVGSPLLILVVILIIDMIAFAYHKVRK